MIDRNNAEWGLVRVRKSDQWKKRLVLWVNDDDTCIAVKAVDADTFLSGGEFTTNIWNQYAPLHKTTYVKKASEIVKWLEDNGYEVDEDGEWHKKGCLSFTPRMFECCGKQKSDDWSWLPEWLEEREEE